MKLARLRKRENTKVDKIRQETYIITDITKTKHKGHNKI